MKLAVLLAVLQLASAFSVGGPAASYSAAAMEAHQRFAVTPTMAGFTVAEARDTFRSSFGSKVVSMPLQAFINEMLQSTTFATAAKTYRYSPVMALGFVRLWYALLIC